jgi:outer membrane lipase/esterase
MLKKFITAALSAAIILSSAANALQYSQVGNIYFFGDSLTDSGFNDLWPTIAAPPTVPPLPAGKAPTFTTFGGYTWAQYIARDIKGVVLPVYPGPSPADTMTNNSCCNVPGFVSGTLTGFNYAAGGSTTNSIGVSETWAPSLITQVNTFLNTPGRTIHPNDIFFIWAGANDLLAVLSDPPTNDLELEYMMLKAAKNAAVNITNAVASLSAKGARRFVIMSLPNIGRAPLVTVLNDPFLTQAAKNVSFTFDSMLNQQLGTIVTRYNIKFLYVNVYALLDEIINNANLGLPYYVQGEAFLFTNTTVPVCGYSTSAIYCTETSNGYLFADLLHPTDMAHRVISLRVESLIKLWQ